MTMAEGMVNSDGLSVSAGQLALQIHLPWYRSLPICCLESVQVSVDGAPAPIRALQVPGFAGSITDAADADAAWDLRDPLGVALDAPGRAGQAYALQVAVAVRIPYIQQAPGVPLVQRATVRTEVTAR